MLVAIGARHYYDPNKGRWVNENIWEDRGAGRALGKDPFAFLPSNGSGDLVDTNRPEGREVMSIDTT